MATRAQFKLEGVEELIKKLRTLRGAQMRKVYRQAMRAAARPVLATAKQIVPIGTSRLQRSLKIRALKRSKKLLGVQITPGTREQLGIPGSAKGFYPTHIELGYKRGFKKSSRSVGRISRVKFPGNRFLRDAVLLERSSAIRIINARIKAGIAKAVK